MTESAIPVWVWIVVGVAGATLLGVAGWFFGTWLWHRFSRRYMVRLIGGRENFLASWRNLEAVLRHLADEPEEALLAFAADPESVDRKAFVEVARRMEILAEELWTMPLPKRLWPAAQALGDSAAMLAREAGRVGELAGTDEVLGALAEMDLGRVARVYERAERLIEESRAYYDVEETAVYGGGLYI